MKLPKPAPRRKFLDPNHPMFNRVWVRWVCVLIPLAWAVFEFLLGEPIWGGLFGALGVYAGFQLFFAKK